MPSVKSKNTPNELGLSKYGGQRAGDKTAISWSGVDAMVLHHFAAMVTDCGDALVLGRTSDGGALMATILSDGMAEKKYWSSVMEADDAMRSLSCILDEWVASRS